MNIEYLKLSDGKTAVTNEKGRIKVINDDISGEELIAENKLDIINKSIPETKMKIENYKDLVSLSKFMLITQPIIAALVIILGCIVGNMYGGLAFLIGGLSVCVPTILVFGITYPQAKKRLDGYKGKLRRAEELKKEENRIISKENKLVKTYSQQINKPISLTAQNKIELPLVNKQLKDAYTISAQSKPKKLIRERKINKR